MPVTVWRLINKAKSSGMSRGQNKIGCSAQAYLIGQLVICLRGKVQGFLISRRFGFVPVEVSESSQRKTPCRSGIYETGFNIAELDVFV